MPEDLYFARDSDAPGRAPRPRSPSAQTWTFVRPCQMPRSRTLPFLSAARVVCWQRRSPRHTHTTYLGSLASFPVACAVFVANTTHHTHAQHVLLPWTHPFSHSYGKEEAIHHPTAPVFSFAATTPHTPQ
jgi:hypothetical protein